MAYNNWPNNGCFTAFINFYYMSSLVQTTLHGDIKNEGVQKQLIRI